MGGWRQSGSKRGERKKLGVQAKREQSTLKQRLSWQAASAGGRGLSETPLGKRVLEVPLPGAKGTKAVPMKLGDLMAWSEGRKNRLEGDE